MNLLGRFSKYAVVVALIGVLFFINQNYSSAQKPQKNFKSLLKVYVGKGIKIDGRKGSYTIKEINEDYITLQIESNRGDVMNKYVSLNSIKSIDVIEYPQYQSVDIEITL